MNKQEIINEIIRTEKHLKKMKNKLECYEYKKWKPNEGDYYFYIDQYGSKKNTKHIGSTLDEELIDFYNCFKTYEEAHQEGERILIRRQLEDIAKMLNRGHKLDWNNLKQCKFFIYYSNENGCITYDSVFNWQTQGVVYCLDENFKDVAIQEIGVERLKKYLRGE